MIVRKIACLVAVAALGVVCVGSWATSVRAADAPQAVQATSAATTAAPDTAAVDTPKVLEWKDYKVKGYSLSFYGGAFSGARYLDLKQLSPRTILTPGAGDVIGYDGSVLAESVDFVHYTAARKEIESGTAFGGRVGIYVGDDFHLDLVGNYMSGRAVTSMLYNPNRDDARNEWTRVEIDEDNGFRAYKGGVSLMYDARPATFLGATPQLGFGLGGVINRYSELEDKTALYLEGNFGLSFQPLDDLKIIARADLAIFAFEVDELGYSEMVSYKNFTVGAAWFIDTVPAEVRAKHLADQKKTRR